jgi:hypothetical protein
MNRRNTEPLEVHLSGRYPGEEGLVRCTCGELLEEDGSCLHCDRGVGK